MTNAFPDYMHAVVGYYVYRLVDPRDNSTFYVGKGVGNRVFTHVADAVTDSSKPTLKFERIREIESLGLQVRHIIHRHGLTEKEAYEVEAALIDAYEIASDGGVLANLVVGHHKTERGMMSAEDVIALHGAERVEIQIPALLLNLRQQYQQAMTPEQLYERTRGNWVLRPEGHPRVKHAMPVAFGIIREVYRIESWEQIDVRSEAEHELRRTGVDRPSRSNFRWRFVGEPDEEMRVLYVGKSIAIELRGQNPISWFDSTSVEEAEGERARVVRGVI